MADRVFLVHGWSVESTTTYRGLDKALAAYGFEPDDILLGRYVSLDDHVTIGDLANGLARALEDRLPGAGEEYHFVTHSTGALVVRDWLRRHYRPHGTQAKVGNIVMLAGPQFGSRLAHLGRSVLAKLKWFGDTGDEVLHGLELGSALQWDLGDDLLERGPIRETGDARLFAVTGDSFRTNKLAARVVPASAETGSDGTVRTSSANLNLTRLNVRLVPEYHWDEQTKRESVTWNAQAEPPEASAQSPFLVLPKFYHTDDRRSGNRGILRSIRANDTIESSEPLAAIVECLRVGSKSAYDRLAGEYRTRTESHFRPSGWHYMSKAERDADERKHGGEGDRGRRAFSQLQFRFRTDAGAPITDYRFEMLARKDRQELNTRTIEHVHVNRRHKDVITFFLEHRHFEPDLRYEFLFAVNSPTTLLHDVEARVRLEGKRLRTVVSRNATTQIDVIVERAPLIARGTNLPGVIGFTPSNDPARHLSFDRHGRAKDTGLSDDHGLKK